MGMTKDETIAAGRFLKVARQKEFSDGTVVWAGAVALGPDRDAVSIFATITKLAEEAIDEEGFLERLDALYPPCIANPLSATD